MLTSYFWRRRERLPVSIAVNQLTIPSWAGVLHTIFFHRYFPSIRPSLYLPSSSAQYSSSRSPESLPIPLPTIQEPPEVTAAIETHTAALVSQLTSPSSTSPGAAAGGSRGEIVIQLFDRKRRKTGITGGWLGRFGGTHQTEEEICWEEWVVQVVVARPRTEAGMLGPLSTVFNAN